MRWVNRSSDWASSHERTRGIDRLGTAIGCILGGYLSRGRINPVRRNRRRRGNSGHADPDEPAGSHNGHLLGFYGSLPVLVLLGTFSGMFIVPVQVTPQSVPPPDEKGRMIATMNQFSWVGVILARFYTTHASKC